MIDGPERLIHAIRKGQWDKAPEPPEARDGATRREKMSAGKTTDAGFEADVLKSDVPVLVDFWAEWCGPCKAIAPALDAIAAEQAGKVKVIKVNVDENEDTPAKYGVRSIPTLMLFKGGEVVGQKIGGTTKSEIEKLIASA